MEMVSETTQTALATMIVQELLEQASFPRLDVWIMTGI